MQDAYLRLDQDMAHLLEFLDSELGLENVLIYLTAENALAVDPRYLADYRIPAGFFNYRTSHLPAPLIPECHLWSGRLGYLLLCAPDLPEPPAH